VPGRGPHYGLPGHGFVLIDARSAERRYGEYPWRRPAAGLIQQARARLHA